MKIGIDARFFGTLGKGLGRYTEKLIIHLEKIDHVNIYYIFLRKENFNDYKPKNKNFKKILADYNWYTFEEQIKFPRLLTKYNLDIVHFLHFNVPLFYRKKFIVTIHDLILLHYPTVRATTLNPFIYWIKFFIYKIVIKNAVLRAEKIITVSQFTKKDLLKNYTIQSKKVIVTYEAAEPLEQNTKTLVEQTHVLKKYDIMRPYLLYVGNAYPHKNLYVLLDEFQKVLSDFPELNLIFVGRDDYFYRQLKEYVTVYKKRNILFAGMVQECDLGTIYKNASLYIFASLYEGFGLPPLEAMSYGVPVITNDHECMREILGNSAFYMHAEESGSIENAIKKIYRDKKTQEDLQKKGFEQVKKYSWKKTAQQTNEVYTLI